jgi:hypothetical protein
LDLGDKTVYVRRHGSNNVGSSDEFAVVSIYEHLHVRVEAGNVGGELLLGIEEVGKAFVGEHSAES